MTRQLPICQITIWIELTNFLLKSLCLRRIAVKNQQIWEQLIRNRRVAKSNNIPFYRNKLILRIDNIIKIIGIRYNKVIFTTLFWDLLFLDVLVLLHFSYFLISLYCNDASLIPGVSPIRINHLMLSYMFHIHISSSLQMTSIHCAHMILQISYLKICGK